MEYPYYNIPLKFYKNIIIGNRSITSRVDYSIARCEKCYNSHISILQKKVRREKRALIRGTNSHPLLNCARACGILIETKTGFGTVSYSSITICFGVKKEKEARKFVEKGLKKHGKEKYKVALHYYESALKIFNKIGLGQSEYVKDLKGKIEDVKKNFALNLNEKAKSLYEKGNFYEARENYEKAMQFLTEIGLGQSQNAKEIGESLNTLKNKRGHYEIINSLDDMRKISNTRSILLYMVNTSKDTRDETINFFENKVIPKINAIVKSKNILIALTDNFKNNISTVDFRQFFKNRELPSFGCFHIQNGEITKYKSLLFKLTSKSYIKVANYVLGNE